MRAETKSCCPINSSKWGEKAKEMAPADKWVSTHQCCQIFHFLIALNWIDELCETRNMEQLPHAWMWWFLSDNLTREDIDLATLVSKKQTSEKEIFRIPSIRGWDVINVRSLPPLKAWSAEEVFRWMTFSKRLCDISFSAQRLFYFAGVSKLNFRRGQPWKMKVFGTEANLFLLVMFCFSKPLLEEKVVVF